MSNNYGPKIVTDGLVLCLDAADRNSYPGSGSTWYDLSGNGYNCSIQSDAVLSSEGVILDGTGSHLRGNITASSLNSSEFSILAWFNRDTEKTWDAIFSNNCSSTAWSNTQKQAPLMTFNGVASYRTKIGLNAAGTTATGIFLDLGADHYGKWIYCVITKTGTSTQTINVYAYKDGYLLSTSGTYTYAINFYDNYLIGRHWYNNGDVSSQIFDGKIQMVSYYRKALSLNEIRQNYNATKGRFGL